MEKKPKISRRERLEIGILLHRGYGVREIARVLGRSPSTVSEEVRRNRVNGSYDPLKAQHKAYVRRKYATYQGKKINEHMALREYIVEKLKLHWNPDEIAGRMKKDRLSFFASKTAIYAWLQTSTGDRYCGLLYSQRHRVKRRRMRVLRTLILSRIGIEKRPSGATNRSRYGHWEGDTVVSGKKTGSTVALSVLYERKSRFVTARKIPNLKPDSHAQAVRAMLQGKKALSLTQDNGIENLAHQKVGVPTFFCDPYSSWQKGGVEHANKMLRRSFPKGMDLALVSEEELAYAVNRINAKPRRSLGFASATEVARRCGILQKEEANVRCSDSGVN